MDDYKKYYYERFNFDLVRMKTEWDRQFMFQAFKASLRVFLCLLLSYLLLRAAVNLQSSSLTVEECFLKW